MFVINGKKVSTIRCPECNTSGANMKRCSSCGSIWCANCATKGKNGYPRQNAINVCPYCGKTSVHSA